MIAMEEDMLKKNKKMKLRSGVPPWIFIGAVVVLLPIFAFITFENINRQRANNVRLLLEKSAALIRSFEAGTRTGLMGNYFSGRQLQNLLAETALQRDIVYLTVVDTNGMVLAHNDISQLGKRYGRELNLKNISRSSGLKWRLRKRDDGKKIFEVVRRFSPTGGHLAETNALRMFRQLCRPYVTDWKNIGPAGYVIFVGLDMGPVQEAEKADIREAIIMTSVMLLAGFAGIILLFMTHNYRAARTSLSRIKAFSDNLVEHMPIGLIALDQKKKIASLNHVAEKIFCLSNKDVIGKDIGTFLPKELCEMIDTPEIRDRIIEKEVDCHPEGGRAIGLQVSATSHKDEDGAFGGYVLLFKDLTEVRALKKAVARSQRLASVGRLAAGVAHEIRNPLSSIKGFATYFKDRYQGIPEDQETADIMIQEVDRLNRVVGQLLEFARPVTVEKKSTDIRALVSNSIKLIEPQAAEKNISIRIDQDNNINNVFIDPDKINQVLLNLHLNAIESMEKGGTISVALKTHQSIGRVEIKVSDTGMGIEKKDLPNIFDPFFTTKSTGTGIGLAVVHNIVEAHNGQIKVESKPGQGSEFTVILPDGAERD